MGQHMDEAMRKPFALLLGRKTYDVFAAHWPYVADDPAADALNSATKHVVSTTLDKFLITGDIREQVAHLKADRGPEIQVHGSWQLIQTLMKYDLVDEYRVWTFPLLLGSGKRLLSDGTIPAGLRLVDSKTSSTGVIIATYKRAGELDYGSFALEEPTEAELERRRGLADY